MDFENINPVNSAIPLNPDGGGGYYNPQKHREGKQEQETEKNKENFESFMDKNDIAVKPPATGVIDSDLERRLMEIGAKYRRNAGGTSYVYPTPYIPPVVMPKKAEEGAEGANEAAAENQPSFDELSAKLYAEIYNKIYNELYSKLHSIYLDNSYELNEKLEIRLKNTKQYVELLEERINELELQIAMLKKS